MRYFVLGLIFAALFIVTEVAAAQQANPSRGQLLYETHCIECHSSQIHWRDARAAKDYSSLRTLVAKWQGRSGQQWAQEDVEAVTQYLNDSIYHFETVIPGLTVSSSAGGAVVMR